MIATVTTMLDLAALNWLAEVEAYGDLTHLPNPPIGPNPN